MNVAAPMAGSAPARTPPVVPRLLAEYGSATRDRVNHWLSLWRPAPYLDALLVDYPSRGGKSMRPAILIATACAAGAKVEEMVDAAAAVELFHNAQLIHDDVEDDSDVRRGRPTLHRLHGVPLAVNAGSAAMLLALDPLIAALRPFGPTRLEAGLALTRRAARDSASGQALDLGWRETGRLDLADADYLRMVLLKTASTSVVWPVQLGLLLGKRSPAVRDRLGAFAALLGLAFQIQDDLLNLRADRAYGKERLGDLREGKRTLMLLHAARRARDSDLRMIDQWQAAAPAERSADLLEAMAGSFVRLGSVAHAELTAHALAGAAGHELDLALKGFAESANTEFLKGLVPWIFERI